jgi:hypothetical protein
MMREYTLIASVRRHVVEGLASCNLRSCGVTLSSRSGASMNKVRYP